MCCKTFFLLAFLMVTMALTNAQKEPDDIKSVRSTDQKLDLALSRSNATALDQLLEANYVEINSQGEMSDKGQLLAFARARKSGGILAGPERKVSEQGIRLHGNTAIVVHMISTRYIHMDYQTSGTPPAQGPESVDQERRMRVYSRNGSTWQLVAQQTTFIPKR